MKINQFANHVAKTEDLKEDLKHHKNDLTNIEEAIEEIELVDDDQIQFLIGEVFVYNNLEKTQELLKETKEKKEQDIKNIEAKIAEISVVMQKLKTELYGKFGQKNIYLENDEE
jgi:prefoldin subunit 4